MEFKVDRSYDLATVYEYLIVGSMVLVFIDPPYPPITMTLNEWESNNYSLGSSIPSVYVEMEQVNEALGLPSDAQYSLL